eukprot:1137795-Pelagomonas_calceolata.AAC.3
MQGQGGSPQVFSDAAHASQGPEAAPAGGDALGSALMQGALSLSLLEKGMLECAQWGSASASCTPRI